MLRHRDFVPQLTTSAGFLSPADYEPFEDVVEALNAWLRTAEVKLVSVETVVLPNIWSPHEEGSEDTSLGMRDTSNHWHQFIRCWYLEKGPAKLTDPTSDRSDRSDGSKIRRS
jgi:hypothetical protein